MEAATNIQTPKAVSYVQHNYFNDEEFAVLGDTHYIPCNDEEFAVF